MKQDKKVAEAVKVSFWCFRSRKLFIMGSTLSRLLY